MAGGLGEHTVMDRETVPPRVSKLHYVFEGWLGDDLLETYPCFTMTKLMAERLTQLDATGFTVREVEVSTSGAFEDYFLNQELPEFLWLDVTGTPAQDDLGLESDARLVVSARVLGVLRSGHLEHCEIESYP